MKPLTRPVRRNPTGLIFSTENRESMGGHRYPGIWAGSAVPVDIYFCGDIFKLQRGSQSGCSAPLCIFCIIYLLV